MDKIKEAQWMLYKWMGCFEMRKEDSIRKQCEFLNESMDLGIKSKPIWVLFFPMVYNGVADFAGKGYYALTSSITIDCGDFLYGVNVDFNHPTKLPVGFSLMDKNNNSKDIKTVKANPLSILKAMPSLQEVVDNWPNEIVSIKSLKFLNKKGLADLEEGFKRYFCIPEKNYIKGVPPRDLNPEAYNIAYCYTNVINNQVTGVYDKEKKVLKVNLFAFPIMLYRVLMLEGLKLNMFPKQGIGCLYFFNISSSIKKELNRILEKSIAESSIEVKLNDKFLAEFPQQTKASSDTPFLDVVCNPSQLEDKTAEVQQKGLPTIKMIENQTMDSIQDDDDKSQVKQMYAQEQGLHLLDEKILNGQDLAKRSVENQADYKEARVADIVYAMAKQITTSRLNWAERSAKNIDFMQQYAAEKVVLARIVWENLPKGAYCIPCSTFNSDLPNQAFVWMDNSAYCVAFKERPTYSMYRKLNKAGILKAGVWRIERATTADLERLFGAAWKLRYIKG